MSVQLIVYPQSYDGVFNATTSNPNQMLTNGSQFTALNTTSTFQTSSTQASFPLSINNYAAPPSVPNTWYRYRYSIATFQDYPTESGGNVTFDALTYQSSSGIYQKLTNLTIGTQYTVTVNFSQFVLNSGIMEIHIIPQGTTQPFYYAPTGSVTFNFTALNQLMVFFLVCKNGTLSGTPPTGGNINVSSITITEAGQSAAPVVTLFGDGQVICDLYEEESLPLTLSIDEFKNASEQVKSYSKAFKLPGTKRNNLIFENLFEITRTVESNAGFSFNPYARTQCILKQDGFVLFEGYLRMIDIQDQEGEISYNVNLYSEVISLADYLKDRKFKEIDFSELEHEYDKSKIKGSWDTNGLELSNNLPTGSFAGTAGQKYTDVLKYPFVDWNHQWLYADGSTGSNATAGMPELTSLEQAFRPFIKIKYLIEKIFEPSPFTFTSEFFDTADFKNLFMDFNWGDTVSPIDEETYSITGNYFHTWAGGGSGNNIATTSFTPMILSSNVPLLPPPTPPNYNDTTHIITSTGYESYTIQYSYDIENTKGSPEWVECQWLHNTTPIDNSGQVTVTSGTIFTYTGTINVTTSPGDTLQAQFKAGSAANIRQRQTTFPTTGAVVNFLLRPGSLFNFDYLQNLRGDLDQWEFLKGIITMFNLISLPDKSDPNNIIIEPYKDVFLSSDEVVTFSGASNPNFFDNNSKQLDWTDKIDVTQIKLEPLTDLKQKMIFKFVEDDDDFAFMNYKNKVEGHLYGSQLYDATLTAGGFNSILTGEEEIVPEPFAATVPKPLDPIYPDLIVPAIYSYDADEGTSSGFDNSPRIMYNAGKVTLSSSSYYIPAQNGLSSENSTEYLQFSHLTEIPPVFTTAFVTGTRDFHFGECQLIPPIGVAPVDNLFRTYWLPYLNELYDANTRTMTIKVNLTAGDINEFNFYDVVFIKNRQFRCNKIEYKPNDLSTVEFILLT